MQQVIVTGCAGFIGSALCRKLLEEGYRVIGIDCLLGNYALWIKQKNLEPILAYENFSFMQEDLLELNWEKVLADTDYVFHLAAVPGVRTSWGKSFDIYVRNNIMATQNLLEAVKDFPIKKFVYASSSSIYGITNGSTSEEAIPLPISPYGVTKLAGEQLCRLYAANYGVPTISLRYFTVYGQGQRPDMAFHKFIYSQLRNEPVIVYGDGLQSRDFTYVADAVAANMKAMHYTGIGEVFNIGGQSHVVLLEVIAEIGHMLAKKPDIHYINKQAGDPPHTWAEIKKAEKMLGYSPQIPLKTGLLLEIEYIKNLYKL